MKRMKRPVAPIVLAVVVALAPILGCHGSDSHVEKRDAAGPDVSAVEIGKSDAYVADTGSPVVGNKDSAGPADSANADASKADTWFPDTAPVADVWVQSSDASGFPASSTKTLSELTTSERQILCDQVAGNQGGYGRVVRCDGSTQTTDASQGSCVGWMPSVASQCPTLTVGDLVGCSLATGPDLCKYPTAAECAAVFKCLG